MTMKREMALWLVVVVLAGLRGRAGGDSVSDGGPLFQAEGRVTFGALYTDRAVRATVVTALPAKVAVRTGRAPTNVFLGNERLPATAWQFETATGVVRLPVPGGTTALQVRFDDLVDLQPFTAPVPVVLMQGDAASAAGDMAVTVAAETLRGALPWAGPEGLYQIQASKEGRAVGGITISAGSGGADGVLLRAGTVVQCAGEAAGQKLPFDHLVCRLLAPLTAMQRVARETLFSERSVVVEGEAFTSEGGGSVTRSTEHAGTHGGACICVWGTAGHWIAWEVSIPADGPYALTLVGASQEAEAVRTLAIDGRAAPGAAVLRFEGTGGWGRTQTSEWQAMQAVAAEGVPVRLALTAGVHELRLGNLLGQHLNVDCLVLTPTP